MSISLLCGEFDGDGEAPRAAYDRTELMSAESVFAAFSFGIVIDGRDGEN